MVGRGAGGRDGVGRAVQAELHRQVAGRAVGHDARHRQRMHPRRTLAVECKVGGVQAGLPDDGGDDGGPAVRLRRVWLQAGLGHRLPRRDDGKLRAAVQQRQAPRFEVLGGIETRDFRRNPGRQPVRGDAGDRPDPGPPSQHPGPHLRCGVAQRADGPQPGDGDPPPDVTHPAVAPSGRRSGSPARGSAGRRRSGTRRPSVRTPRGYRP